MLAKLKKWFVQPQPKISDVIKGSITSSGFINPITILSHPAAWRGVDLLSTSIARIPFSVYTRNQTGRHKADDHPAYHLLKTRPNNYYTPFQLVKTWLTNTLVHGNGYIYIDRDEYGRPTSLTILDSTTINTVIEGENLYYTQYANGVFTPIFPSNILHLRGLSSDGFTGIDLSKVLAQSFGLGITLQRYQSVFFENAGRPSILINLPEEISEPDQIQEFRQAWADVHSNVENSFKPALLMPGCSVTQLQNDNAINSLSALREHDLVTMANILGLPPHKLGAKTQSVSYNSLEQENLAFLDSLDGWLVQMEQEIGFKLLRNDEYDTHYVEANREARIQPDSKTKAELLAIYRTNGMMSDEEIRQKLNLSTDMDGTFWTSSNLLTRERAIQMSDAVPVETTVEDKEEDTEEEDKAIKLAVSLTSSSVNRLLRRAEKSGKIDLEFWKMEFSKLPGYADLDLPVDELEHVLPEQRKEIINNLDADEISRKLWKI